MTRFLHFSLDACLRKTLPLVGDAMATQVKKFYLQVSNILVLGALGLFQKSPPVPSLTFPYISPLI